MGELTVSAGAARPLRKEMTRAFLQEIEHADDRGAKENAEFSRRLSDILLRDALEQRATDIHLDPQADAMRVRFRVDGTLLDVAQLSIEHGARVLRHFKATAGMDVADRFHPADARLTYQINGRNIDLRLATLPSICGEKMSIRLLDRNRVLERLDQLGFSEDQYRQIGHWLRDTNGMFLVAGPTGSGKTTTLYALLHELKLHEKSVATIEEPVEYQIDGITQTQVNRRLGLSFAAGLRAMLRSDADYLLLGEIRDAETAASAAAASGSGRVLMSTIHAPDAVSAVTALRNFDLADHQIASSLRLVIAQRLVRRLCAKCRRQERTTEADSQSLASLGLPTTAGELWVPVGCDACQNLGYQGRIGIFEVWHLVDSDYGAILEHADERTLRASASSRALKSLISDGWAKVEQGITSLTELRLLASSYNLQDPIDRLPPWQSIDGPDLKGDLT